ncbi:hypothetical protein RhiirA1_464863 [Rhizophagus irregularis]|uniref:Uncharacterized protein n=1 Tax=Rhizophagus irregularis TaxID=588596 RepID=A0A2I1F9H7_9GLOM|nr:hypothetical protein RhiirA1_464863 [Rhizophagus irregularis]PKY31018.1 hypothetical protein RhiirB3_448404 [Rhizophagus irregularis]
MENFEKSDFGDFLSLFERGNLAIGSFRFLWILGFRRSLRSLDMKFWVCQFFLEMEVAIKFILSFLFIYCGKVAITNFNGPELLKLLIAVNGINIQTLVTCVQKHLINDKKFLQENFMEILQIVYHNELFMELLKYCLEILFNSDKIFNFEAPLLEFLLNRDDLNLNEIKIWNGLIAELNQDISKWNKNYLIIIYSLIRFYVIPFEDYTNKVKPYEEILPKELREEILKFYLPRRFIDSTLINRNISNFLQIGLT